MARMIEARNALVDRSTDPDAPEVRDAGVAILLTGSGQDRFPVGEPVVLHGAYKADRDLLALSRRQPTAAILLTLIRTDRPFGATMSLITPTIDAPPPASRDIALSDAYREGGHFRVDLAEFFELPAEPGTYAIQAAFGPWFSARLPFAIVKP